MVFKDRMRDQGGFSLVEVMVALAILSVVLAGVVKMFTSTGHYHTSQEMIVAIGQDIRAAKHLMIDEIRCAGCNPMNKIRIGFQTDGDDRYDTDANSIHFTRDIDNGDGDELYEPDGDVGDADENISYYRVDAAGNVLAAGNNTIGTLVRKTGSGVGQPVADNITNLQFQYYDSNNVLIPPATMTSTAVLDFIRTVEVTISGQVQNPNLVSPANRIWTQQFRVRVRNL